MTSSKFWWQQYCNNVLLIQWLYHNINNILILLCNLLFCAWIFFSRKCTLPKNNKFYKTFTSHSYHWSERGNEHWDTIETVKFSLRQKQPGQIFIAKLLLPDVQLNLRGRILWRLDENLDPAQAFEAIICNLTYLRASIFFLMFCEV